MSNTPWSPSAAAGAEPATTGTGRVSVRDPDGGRHVIEVLGHSDGRGRQSPYQVRVDGWYHAAWASSTDDVRMTLDRVRRAIAAGWLPGDADLPG
jgi:hypothetical protein